MMTTAGVVKETVLIGTLNIVLPTADVYSDGALVYTLYRGNPYHPNCNIWDTVPNPILNKTFDVLTINKTCVDGIPEEQLEYDHHLTWATLLLIPFMLNYMASWYAWYQMDKRKQFTWLACLVGLYPQLRAVNIIRELWRDPKRGLSKKKKFERDLSEKEVFLEAVPTTFILTYIAGRLQTSISLDRRNIRAGVYLNIGLFVSTLFTSIITASLGMSKALKVGVCKILPNDKGPLGGFLSIRFILIFLASFFTLFSKAGVASRGILDTPLLDNIVLNSISSFLPVILPGLITGIIFIGYRAILKTSINHPSLFLLPIFTFFSFTSNSKWCCVKKDGSPNEVEICFSVRATVFNMICSCLVDAVLASLFIQKHDSTFLLVLLFLGVLFTMILLWTICKWPSSYSSPSGCCSSCLTISSSSYLCLSSSSCASSYSESCCSSLSSFSASCCPPLQFGIYLPSSPHKVFIKDQTEPNSRKEIKEMEEETASERSAGEEIQD